MPKATPEQTRKANRAAAIVSLCVALFAALVMGSVFALDRVAAGQARDEIVIEEDDAEINPFYVLLIGSDTRKGTAIYTGQANEDGQLDQRSDTMTLMRVDPRKYRVSLLTIPRDTVLSADGGKINDALLENDPEDVVEAVYQLTGLRADYYMMTTFLTFADLVDALGGVEVDVPKDVTVGNPSTGGNVTVKAGEAQLLDGDHALAFARARFAYADQQDAVRQSNVRALEKAIIQRVLSGDVELDAEALVEAMTADVVTNMDLAAMASTIVDFVEHADKVKVYEGTGPYEVVQRADDDAWVVMPDEETWKQVMKAFKRGKKFSDIVEPPDVEALIREQEEAERAAAGKSSGSASAASSSAASAKSSGSSSGAAAKSGSASSSAESSNAAAQPSGADSAPSKQADAK